jgi:hypothetical protein
MRSLRTFIISTCITRVAPEAQIVTVIKTETTPITAVLCTRFLQAFFLP